MAGAGYKLFNTGDVLTAAQVNTYLQEQTVMVFATATARTTALSGVLAEGMMSYLQDTNAVEVYNGSSWVSVGSTGDITGVTAGTGISGGGSSGDVTITNSMATAIDAKGDLIVGTGADTFARLAVGTNGYTIVADSAETTGLKWQAASSGGMTEIATGTLSGASVTINSIPGTYRDLRLVITNYRPATDGTALAMRYNGDSNTYYSTRGTFSSTGFGIGDTETLLCADQDNTATTSIIVATIYEYASTSTLRMSIAHSLTNDPTNVGQVGARLAQGVYTQTTAVTSLTLFPATGNFNAGTYKLYGVK